MHTKYFYFLPFFFFIAGYYGMVLLTPISTYDMPCLIGFPLTKSVVALSQRHLNARVLIEKEDDSLEAGTVIDQIPRPGQRIKEHQPVFLTLSKKSEKIKSPDLLGKTNIEALKYLKNNNLRSKIYTIPASSLQGTIVAQWPSPHAPLEKQAVLLYCADNPDNLVIFPNLVGQELSETQHFLASHGVHTDVSFPNEEKSLTVKTYYIKNQKPLAGSLVDLQKPLFVRLQVEA